MYMAVRREDRFARIYALKRLHPHLRADANVRKMFLDEGRLAGLVRHANVVSVLDVGEDDEGPFLVMDFIEGMALSEIIQSLARRGEQLETVACLEIAKQIADGLYAAHELKGRGGQPLHLVHRDISPQNILVGFDGTVRITDFGVAKAVGQACQTHMGVLKGKLGYMPPEQFRYEKMDHRSDLFAFGIVLYEMLAGCRGYPPNEAEHAAYRILNEPPLDIDTHRPVPPELSELLFSLMAKTKSDRPADARVVSRALDRMLSAHIAEEGHFDLAELMREMFPEKLAQNAARTAKALSERPCQNDTGSESNMASTRPHQRSGVPSNISALLDEPGRYRTARCGSAWRGLGGNLSVCLSNLRPHDGSRQSRTT